MNDDRRNDGSEWSKGYREGYKDGLTEGVKAKLALTAISPLALSSLRVAASMWLDKNPNNPNAPSVQVALLQTNP